MKWNEMLQLEQETGQFPSWYLPPITKFNNKKTKITEPPTPHLSDILNDLKENENYFKLVGSLSYRGFELPQVKCHLQDVENRTDQELMNLKKSDIRSQKKS